MIWIKRRDGAGHHSWFDAVRGNKRYFKSNRSQDTEFSTDYYSAFDTDGFTIGTDSMVLEMVMVKLLYHGIGKQMVVLTANTDGDINTTTVSANTTAGFSMVKFTTQVTGSAFNSWTWFKCSSRSDYIKRYTNY